MMTRTATDEATLGILLPELGERCRAYRYQVAPNPCVGAAVLCEGRVLGEGFHQCWGEPHAEVNALASAELSGIPRERWDTMVVTLEPCSSHGKTGPCTEAILSTGIRRVVIGETDPDPRHRGVGVERLREAGLEVELHPGVTPLREVAPYFEGWVSVERIRRPRPWLIAKWAQTRTGQLTPPEDVGEGRWISSPPSLNEVMALRGRVDAVLSGVGTVLADDPRYTVRLPGDVSRKPLRVILDSHLRTSPRAALLCEPGEGEGGGPVHFLTLPGSDPRRHRQLVEAGAQVHGLRAGSDGLLSLRSVLEWMWERGLRRVLLEGGPTLQKAFFEAGFTDQLRIYSGDINGGSGESLAELLDPRGFEDVLHREVGQDAVLEALLKRRI